MRMYLLCFYVSATFAKITERMETSREADVLCSIAMSYREWLLGGIKLSDNHFCLCAHFMTMSGDFLEFVTAYRFQDSITIESGYSWFAPSWKILGQLKYYEAYHEQLDCLLKNNKYLQLEEARRNCCVGRYHGDTGKLALAHDEWLELNNKEFSLYPSVWMFNGMSRQVQFIGLTHKAKHVVETIYSPGSISELTIHGSGAGSKGNYTLQKNLIGEVVTLFLRIPFDPANVGRVLESRYMLTLEHAITTKLDRNKLDTETTFIQHNDLARVLLNGVNHIYGRIRTIVQCKRTNTENLLEGIDDVINEVMEYEPETLVPNIDDAVFDVDNDDDEDIGDDDKENLIYKGERVSWTCLTDLVETGWKRLREMNMKKVRMVANKCFQWKSKTTRYIMDRVAAMKEEFMTTPFH
jgi:hypothetical protein